MERSPRIMGVATATCLVASLVAGVALVIATVPSADICETEAGGWVRYRFLGPTVVVLTIGVALGLLSLVLVVRHERRGAALFAAIAIGLVVGYLGSLIVLDINPCAGG